MMTLMWLLACTDKPTATPDDTIVDTDTVVDTATETDTGEAGRGPVELLRLTDAEDLDPAEGAVRVALTAAAATQELVDVDGTVHTIDGYAYNGVVPGPTIRAQVGDVVTVELTNELDAGTTIHWHGLAVPFEMDGVTWMSEPVAPGGSFTYTFTAEEAGTFWYHPHFDTDHQVSKGLYGAFIVEDPSEPVPDEDLLLVISDWYLGEAAESTELMEGDHQAAEGTWTVNGQVQPTLTVTGGSTLRVRAVNVSNHSYLDLRWPDVRLIGTDQGIGSALSEPEGVLLSPGDRMEAEWLIGEAGFSLEDAPYVHQGGAAWGESEPLMAVAVSEPAAAPAGLSWPFSGLEPSEDPGQADITYVFSGSRESGVWLMNGAVFPEVDIDTVALGESAIIEVRNLSPAEHPYHLHGMHFEVLSVDGVPPASRQVEDTINVGIYGVVRLKIVANNPGDWMSHCHILPHAEGGMMTVLRVSE